MYRLMLICIIVCSAWGCVDARDPRDAGTDADTADVQGCSGVLFEECREGQHRIVWYDDQCVYHDDSEYCLYGCHEDMVRCIALP